MSACVSGNAVAVRLHHIFQTLWVGKKVKGGQKHFELYQIQRKLKILNLLADSGGLVNEHDCLFATAKDQLSSTAEACGLCYISAEA